MIRDMENYMDFTKKLFELVSDFGKFVRYKIDTNSNCISIH